MSTFEKTTDDYQDSHNISEREILTKRILDNINTISNEGDFSEDFKKEYFLATTEFLHHLTKVDEIYHLDYHSPEHSLRSANRFLETAKDIYRIDPTLYSLRDILIGTLIILNHDVYQESDTPLDNPPSVSNKLIRHRGTNEQSSSVILDYYQLGNEGLTSTNIFYTLSKYPSLKVKEDEVDKLLNVTYPGFGIGPKSGLRIYQPYLYQQNYSMLTFLFANADLNACGEVSPNEFIKEHLSEFRETSVGIKNFLVRSKPLKELQQEERSREIEERFFILNEIIKTFESGVSFAKWRKKYFMGSIIMPFSENVQEYVDGKVVDVHVEVEITPDLETSSKKEEIQDYLLKRFSNFDRSAIAANSAKCMVIEEVAKLNSTHLDVFVQADLAQQESYIKRAVENDESFYNALGFAGYEIDRKGM